MRLHVLSDIHLEFGDYEPPPVDADAVVLAGDIGVGLQGIDWINEHFQDVPRLYVPGNHEFYHRDVALIEDIKARAGEKVFVMDDDQIVIGNVRFLGCMLWTDFALYGEARRPMAMDYTRRCMSDFSVIRDGSGPFTPERSVERHVRSRNWLDEQLALPHAGPTVVITHHAPTRRSVAERYKDDLLSSAFASDLESTMAAGGVNLWVHGHMHDSVDVAVGGTRIVCNPRGYVDLELNPSFDADLVIELD